MYRKIYACFFIHFFRPNPEISDDILSSNLLNSPIDPAADDLALNTPENSEQHQQHLDHLDSRQNTQNLASLKRIFELEHQLYKSNDKINVLEKKLAKRDSQVSSLQHDNKILQVQLKKEQSLNLLLSKQIELPNLSVGSFHCFGLVLFVFFLIVCIFGTYRTKQSKFYNVLCLEGI